MGTRVSGGVRGARAKCKLAMCGQLMLVSRQM